MVLVGAGNVLGIEFFVKVTVKLASPLKGDTPKRPLNEKPKRPKPPQQRR
jgi:hypothetical protein